MFQSCYPVTEFGAVAPDELDVPVETGRWATARAVPFRLIRMAPLPLTMALELLIPRYLVEEVNFSVTDTPSGRWTLTEVALAAVTLPRSKVTVW